MAGGPSTFPLPPICCWQGQSEGEFTLWPYIIMGSPQNNSGAFIGFNYQLGWSSHAKSTFNIAMPGSSGNVNLGNSNFISDNDVFDIANQDDDVNLGIR